MHRVLHRLLSSSAAALTAVAVVTAPGTPAQAAEPTLSVHFSDLSVVGKAPKSGLLFASIDVPGKTPVRTGALTLTVDTAGVTGIATVTTFDEYAEPGDEENCATKGTVITCAFGGPQELPPGTLVVPLLALQVTAKPGAAEGAAGKLALKLAFAGGASATSQSTVTIGQGVDLAGVIAKPVTVTAGATAEPEVRVTNAGTVPVKGVELLMLGWDPILSAGTEGFSNCTYGEIVLCSFDDELAAGATYELSEPMQVKIPADAAAGSELGAVGSWYTATDFKELLDSVQGLEDVLGPKGKGGPVSLQQAGSRTRRLSAAGQVDTNPENNLVVSEMVVGGNRQPDLAAVGATVKGAVGDKMATTVGYVNRGPGTLYHWAFDNTNPDLHITVPAGLRTLDADDRCEPLFPAQTGDGDVEFGGDEEYDEIDAPEFVCFVERDTTKADQSARFDFGFQIREKPATTPGQVELDGDVFDEGDESGLLDRDPANNKAAIVLEVTGGDGGGGGLPVTGANAGLIGGLGGLLLLAGAGGLLLVRRRRVRFTA